MTIRFRLLQVDDPRYVGFAKNKVKTTVAAGILNFSRNWIVDDVQISVKVSTTGDETTARLRILSSNQELAKGTPVVRLGSESVITTVSKTGGVGGTYLGSIERTDVANALLAKKKVVYVEPYLSPVGYMVSFTNYGDMHTERTDTHAGTYWLKYVPHEMRQIDFTAGYVWFKYVGVPVGASTHVHPAWAALSIDAIINPYTSEFAIARAYNATLKRNVISDGDQIFELSMAEDRFTLKLTVTFEDEAIESYDTETKGDWTVNILSVAIIKNDATGATLRVKYEQKVLGALAFFVQDIKSWSLPTVYEGGYASSYIYETVNPALFGNDVVGRMTVPILGTLTTRTFYEIVSSAYVTPEPIPLFAYSVATNTWTLSSAAAVTDNFNNAAHSADQTYEASFHIVYSDGSTEEVSAGDSLESIAYSSSSGHPGGIPSSYIYEWYGPNVRGPYSVPVPGGGVATDDIEWTTDEFGSLGYDIKRTVPVRSDFPADKELYEIVTDLTTKRRGLRSRESLQAGSALMVSKIVSSSGYNESITWSASETYSRVLRSFNASATFKAYDAPFSVKKIDNEEHEVMVLVPVNTSTRVVGSATIAVLPPGWAGIMPNFIDAYDPTTSFFAPVIAAFIDELDDLLDFYDGASELADEIARVEATKLMAEQIRVLGTETERTAIANELTSFRAKVAEYHGAHADPDIFNYIDDLVLEFVPSDITKTPRTRRLSGKEIARLKWGYLSCHMEFLTNPNGIKHEVALKLGRGTFLMVSTQS